MFSFFICGCHHHERKTICLYVYISDIRQIVGYRTPVFIQPFPWRLHITITYSLPHLRLWYTDVVTVIAYTPEDVCRAFQTSRHEKDGTWSELTLFETTVLDIYRSLRVWSNNDAKWSKPIENDTTPSPKCTFYYFSSNGYEKMYMYKQL